MGIQLEIRSPRDTIGLEIGLRIKKDHTISPFYLAFKVANRKDLVDVQIIDSNLMIELQHNQKYTIPFIIVNTTTIYLKPFLNQEISRS